jgi:hypothetical protein
MNAVRRMALTGLPFLILAALLVAGTVPALGKRFVATKRADRVVGTKRADSIRAERPATTASPAGPATIA